jgi:antitoxin (DNA-binding transcriptional repressor) of toxin-antitoxin stability system
VHFAASFNFPKIRFTDYVKSQMTDSRISVTQAARNFSDLINRVHYRNETATLIRGGAAVARLVPAHEKQVRGADLAAWWSRWEHMPTREAEAYAADLEEPASPAAASARLQGETLWG